ncbi:dipeptide/oligopeptide/nickel ABC transporter permease/ATP-binding protein [Kribbella speibonae]|uniref:Dipeptide/oligopeptide/nickel ABC transporter permease/ATP-binding protein n=1 Tax=Kribbella speibonae TaxID=1572660 RepID=A0A4R0IT76_9ACTN|nr:dipeptide/oligopeptide/nickel ABC transporter permease/ATP-binding protein [Kribbella speibonae]TCC36399.1 dipeptide/oligopeptide/nickel ABC transporter permease/ATP-binding protein [Kribbella speibonae]
MTAGPERTALDDELALAKEAPSRSVFRLLLRHPLGAPCLAFVLLVILVAIVAPLLAPYGPQETDLAAVNAPPFTSGHLLGGDSAGLDILSRLIWGSRQTVIAVLIVVVVALVLGVVTGLVAGFYRGRFDAGAGFLSDVIMSLPGIVLLIALYSLTGPNVPAAMAVYGAIIAPTYYRLVRAIVLGVRNELYVDAARVVGLSDARIVGRHVLWAVRAPVIIQSSFVMAAGIGIEAGISFLGLGDPAGTSWGIVLQRSFNGIYNNAWGVLWPALLISITILALILLGNALSDVLQSSARSKVLPPRQRRKAVAAALGELEAGEVRESKLVGSSDDVVLSVRDLRIAYPSPDGTVNEVVHGVDLDVRRGEIHGLVGESGSGKSQIAFSTLGILPPEAIVLGGSVLLDGEDLLADEHKMRAARGRRIAYVPQEPMSNLDPSFTIGSQLSRGLRATRPMAKKEASKVLVDLLQSVGITDPERLMRLYPHEISGGMAQRVLICGAVASEPDIIVADEPTTALDVTVQADVLELLRELCRERGLAMILVTHNLGVVADLCDVVSVMKDGNIVEHQDVDGIFAAPSQAYTRQLLSSSRSVELMEV